MTSQKRPRSKLRTPLVALAVTTCVSLAAYVSYYYYYPSLSFHVRLSLEVEQDGRRKTGSSVIEIQETWGPTWWGLISSREVRSRGEAAYVDLGNGKNLFALLGLSGTGNAHDDIIRITGIAFHLYKIRASTPRDEYLQTLKLLGQGSGQPRALSGDTMPTLASFQNVDDRKSIRAVDPSNLAATIGADAQLIEVSLAVTRDPVTTGIIEKKLPWLRPLIGTDPINNVPIYYVQTPELAQDRIFFTGFVR